MTLARVRGLNTMPNILSSSGSEKCRGCSADQGLAMARSTPIAVTLASSGPAFTAESESGWFGLYLVDPSSTGVEVLGKVRGGPRTWTNLDSLSDFVEALLDSTGLKGRICVHVV